MSLAPFAGDVVSSPARGLVVETRHACARHPDMRGERGCTSCSNALCSACARSIEHRSCPACREAAGKAAHVVDASWRVHLLMDGAASALRALPRRTPALLGILLTALLVPLAVYAVAAPKETDWTDGAALAAAFAGGAFFLGTFLQPLLVLPMIERTKTLRVVAGAFVGALTAFVPLALVGALLGLLTLDGDATDDVLGQLWSLLFLSVAALSMATGLLWQGRMVLGRGPALAGLPGAVVAHACLFGLWSMLLGFALIPIGIVIAVGFAAGPAVAGVVGVVVGVALWLAMLVCMGSFAAGSARYSDDLQRLR